MFALAESEQLQRPRSATAGREILETLEFDNAVKEVLNWAKDRKDTLIIVTADHETGGLSVLQNGGLGEFPKVEWTTGGHTSANVPLYAQGPGAEQVFGVMDNTELFALMKGLPLASLGERQEKLAAKSEGAKEAVQSATE